QRRGKRMWCEPHKAVRLPWSGTFHSVANRLIRKHCQRVGLEPSFSVLDRGDAADLMDVVRHELGLSKTEKRFPRKDTCLRIYSSRVRSAHVLVDEYQDTNLVQAEILKALRPAGEGLTVVGDDAQAIYSFRAA